VTGPQGMKFITCSHTSRLSMTSRRSEGLEHHNGIFDSRFLEDAVTYVFLFCLHKPPPFSSFLRNLSTTSQTSSATIAFTPSHTMSSNDSTSTLQSAIDSVKSAAQSVLGTMTGKEADQVSSTLVKRVSIQMSCLPVLQITIPGN
jgi:hypothetical protein